MYSLTVMLFVPLCGFASIYRDVNHYGTLKSFSLYFVYIYLFLLPVSKLAVILSTE